MFWFAVLVPLLLRHLASLAVLLFLRTWRLQQRSVPCCFPFLQLSRFKSLFVRFDGCCGCGCGCGCGCCCCCCSSLQSCLPKKHFDSSTCTSPLIVSEMRFGWSLVALSIPREPCWRIEDRQSKLMCQDGQIASIGSILFPSSARALFFHLFLPGVPVRNKEFFRYFGGGRTDQRCCFTKSCCNGFCLRECGDQFPSFGKAWSPHSLKRPELSCAECWIMYDSVLLPPLVQV